MKNADSRTQFIAPKCKNEYENMTCKILSSVKAGSYDCFRTRIDIGDKRGRIHDCLTSIKLEGKMFTKSVMSTRVRINKAGKVVDA